MTPIPEQPEHQPVAYDAQGRPLYAHPPETPPPAQPSAVRPPVATTPPATATPDTTAPEQPPQVVHVARSPEPIKQEISPETKERHDRSVRQYPTLNLSDGEYIVSAVRRHPIGLLVPLGLGTLLLGGVFALLFNYDAVALSLEFTGPLASIGMVWWALLLFATLVGIGMYVVYYVYINNKFFLTNESVIQEIQQTLFSRLEQTVSLGNIEDASFTQHGIIQHLFDYGDIRLSTEGDETTYRFSYVSRPKDHIKELNNAVESFKNGRPVESQFTEN